MCHLNVCSEKENIQGAAWFLNLASGAPFRVDAARSLCFTLAFCPQAWRANKPSCEKVEQGVRCSRYRGDITLRVAQFFLLLMYEWNALIVLACWCGPGPGLNCGTSFAYLIRAPHEKCCARLGSSTTVVAALPCRLDISAEISTEGSISLCAASTLRSAAKR